MDDKWIYGGSIQQIYSTIRDGRRNGMPAWKHRLTDQLAETGGERGSA